MVERLTRPFSRFLRIETAGGAALLASTLVALILSNSRWADAFLALWETPRGRRVGGSAAGAFVAVAHLAATGARAQ